MVVDRFTKIVLTFIAVALVLITIIEVIKLAKPDIVMAQGKGGQIKTIQKVAICNERGDFCANVDETGRLFVK